MKSDSATPEEQFEFELEHFRNETVDATCFYCVQRATVFAASHDRTVLRALNHAPLFWNISGNAFQAGLFVVLGRIFDQDSKSKHNIDRLIGAAQRHPEIFGSDAFVARRRLTDQQADRYLPEYMQTFYMPTAEDFRVLRKAIAYYRKIYDDQLRPIRHEYIAHRQRGAADAVQELFSQVQITALEELLSFLSGLHIALQDMYQNGNRPKVRLKSIAIQRWLEMSWRDMPRQTTAEHAVYQLRKCLDQLVNGSPAWIRDSK